MPWQRIDARACEKVVHRYPCSDVEPFPETMGEWIEEGDGPDQVRGDTIQKEATFVECLPDETEVELLQVAESTVDEPAGATRCAGSEVALLDQTDRKTS